MQTLNLPAYPIRTRQTAERTEVFCPLRGRYVRLTPEEWVRQHFTHFLTHDLGYPAALLANEVTLEVNGVARRADSVLYRREGGTPRMVVEYKAPTVEITEAVFQQIYSYNSVLRADYLVVSNGLVHYCCRVDYDAMRVTFLQEIPRYEELDGSKE